MAGSKGRLKAKPARYEPSGSNFFVTVKSHSQPSHLVGPNSWEHDRGGKKIQGRGANSTRTGHGAFWLAAMPPPPDEYASGPTD